MTRPKSVGVRALATVEERLRENKPVRRQLPGWGRIAIDRSLPFVAVYRQPLKGDPGAERLVIGSAAYVMSSAHKPRVAETSALLKVLAGVAKDKIGAMMIVEIWTGPQPESDSAPPSFTIHRHHDDEIEPTVEEFRAALGGARLLRQQPEVSVKESRSIAPPGMQPLLSSREFKESGAWVLGLEVSPVFRDAQGDVFPQDLRRVAQRVSRSINRAAYRFARTETGAKPSSPLALGKRALVRAVWEVDEKLAAIGADYDVLLQVTPVNAGQAYAEFKASGFERTPAFRYRPIPFDVGRMKHRLWAIKPERVEDPTLMYLFRDVQQHMDRELSLLQDIGVRRRFLHTSIQLHGTVEPELLRTAEELLKANPGRRGVAKQPALDAEEFAARVAAEIRSYRESSPNFSVMPQVREDLYSGLMTSRGRVLIGSDARIPEHRADALIQHELGTHALTYYNGGQQRLRLLRTGLPGYDEFQEGLAVLGEYLVGGLDAARMRVLAGRVVAANAMVDGALFTESWRLLVDRGFAHQAAFTVAMRVHRGGGLTKDAGYLRGISSVFDYVASGAEFDRLFLGKYAAGHVPVVEELLLRGVLAPPQAVPLYLHRPEAVAALERVRAGLAITDIV